jgi:hypothetical protein
MNEERELAISPIVTTSVQHNTQVRLWSEQLRVDEIPRIWLTIATQVVSNIRNLTASLFGVAAGTLGFESYTGFIFYLIGSFLVSAFIFAFRTEGKPAYYFHRPIGDLWGGEVLGGLSSFVLTWTLFYGLVRA